LELKGYSERIGGFQMAPTKARTKRCSDVLRGLRVGDDLVEILHVNDEVWSWIRTFRKVKDG
jgi:hypothetical protein